MLSQNRPCGLYAIYLAERSIPLALLYPGGVAVFHRDEERYAHSTERDAHPDRPDRESHPSRVCQIRVGQRTATACADTQATARTRLCQQNEVGSSGYRRKTFQIFSAGTEIVADPTHKPDHRPPLLPVPFMWWIWLR